VYVTVHGVQTNGTALVAVETAELSSVPLLSRSKLAVTAYAPLLRLRSNAQVARVRYRVAIQVSFSVV
jgi:hypothetical protein